MVNRKYTKYKCLRDNLHEPLTKGKTYLIKLNTKDNYESYLIKYYDNTKKVDTLNEYWFHNYFRELKDLNKNIMIL